MIDRSRHRERAAVAVAAAAPLYLEDMRTFARLCTRMLRANVASRIADLLIARRKRGHADERPDPNSTLSIARNAKIAF